MKKITNISLRYKYYAYPFLIALYTVLFLYANNMQQYRLHVLVIPIILVTFFTIIVYSLAQFFFKNISKSSLITSFIVFVTLSYNRIMLPFGETNLKLFNISFGHDIPAVVVILLILIFFVLFLKKKKNDFLFLQKLLTFLSLILIFISLYLIISFEITSKRIFLPENKENFSKIQKGTPKPSDPDIYYFIFDRYAGPKSLSEQYGFDNSVFLRFLKDKGFYVAEKSTTNYPKTFLSVASSLNMDYVNFLTQETNGGKSADESIVTPYIQDNKLIEYLKKRGYTTINIGSWWEPTRTNPNAEKNYFPPKKGYLNSDEFTTGFLNTTIAASLFQVLFHDPMDVSDDPQNNIHRQAALYDFKTIDKEIVKIPGPKFVFTHILLPHDPFVFDKNCKPVSEIEVNKKQHQENYINQVQCANSMIQKMIEKILSSSKRPPIMVFQADEGPFPMNVPLPQNQSWESADLVSLQEKFPIFNAYYFPEKKYETLYQTITPVNSFRIILNKYFKENFQILPDRNYIFQDEDNLYKFIDVTEKVR